MIKAILLMVCLCFSQPALAFSSESSVPDISMSNADTATSILTLQVSSISPQDGSRLTSFPTSLEIKVTRGGLPEQGARVQFWMEGGTEDSFMHNAGLTITDSSGYAHLTLLNKNTLDPGKYVWYASFSKTGLKGGSSKVFSFIVPRTDNKEISISSGTVATNQKDYVLEPSSVADVVIYGNVNNYHMGEPIVLKITSPSGKIFQLVTYGAYLGSFQRIYELGHTSEAGIYAVAIYYGNAVPFAGIFSVVK